MYKFLLVFMLITTTTWGESVASENDFQELIEQIQDNRVNFDQLADLLPIVSCSFQPSVYEQILMTELRNVNTSMCDFRAVSRKLGELLVNKVVECLPNQTVTVETPVASCEGKRFVGRIHLLSVLRSGNALLETFINHFPHASVSKILIQRDEETAEPQFKYMKLSPSLNSKASVIITEPMLATGGTLEMVIALLKEKGVREENIIIACICAAPEGLARLNLAFPKIKVVMTVMDERLNQKKYIVPGIGDFGDRFFGTEATTAAES